MPQINILFGNDVQHAVNKGEFMFEEMPRVGEIVRLNDGNHSVLQVLHTIASPHGSASSAILIAPHPG